MANNTVTVSGMFGGGKTYFADSPVVIDISGLEWPASSPFNIVRMEVIHDGKTVGDFHADTGRQSSISFDISSALRAMWIEETFSQEVSQAQSAISAITGLSSVRGIKEYSILLYTEYISQDDGGVFTRTSFGPFDGGRCIIGGMTEWERSLITDPDDRDVSALDGTNLRYGSGSTKPADTPERVGMNSITSWVSVGTEGTTCFFFPSVIPPAADGATAHAPMVLRDSMQYTDFLFVNRRGAVETCSAPTLEAMNIDVETKQYARVERPAFKPSRSLMAIAKGGRRSWQMSSGNLTRQWADWWTEEFLMARQWWMLYKGLYVPVTVDPAKKSTAIYDRSKQQMPHVDFTVTLALEG